MSFSVPNPTSQSCTAVASGVTQEDINHPGVMTVISGTVINTGEACSVVSGFHSPLITLNLTPGWTMENEVFIPVLPGTTSAAYQIGSATTLTASPWTGGIGFYLSSANGTPNDWYCRYATTSVDTGIAATAAWHSNTADRMMAAFRGTLR